MQRVRNAPLAYINGRMCMNGEPFTGIDECPDANDDGGRAEATYIDGILAGVRRGWYLSGTPCYEEEMLMGVFHGRKREWYPNGQLAEDAHYELGFDLGHTYWDEDGNVIEEFEYDPSDPAYEPLRERREMYKDEIAAEERRRKESKET